MTAFASDTFTGPDGTALSAHTDDLGKTWTLHPLSDAANDWLIDTNRIRPSGAAYAKYTNGGVPPSADYDVDADVVVITTPANYHFGITGRHDTTADTYYFTGFSDPNTFRLLKVIAAAETVLGSETQAPLNCHVKLHMVGTTIQSLRDTVSRFSVTDAGITATGRAGIAKFWDTTTTTGLRFDNFVADDQVVAPAETPVFPNARIGPQMVRGPIGRLIELRYPEDAGITTTPVSSFFDFPYEVLQGLDIPAVLSVSNNQDIAATTSEPIMSSMGVAASTAAVIEALQGLAATGLVPVEALGAVASSSSFPLDEQGQILVSQTGVFFIESLAAAVQSALFPVEAPQGIAAVGSFPLSALAGITQTGTSTIDMVKPAATTGLFPFSAPQGVTNTNQQIIDILAGLAATGVYPLDETKDLASTGLLPINSQAPASASGVFPVEALGVPIFAVSNTAQMFIEALAAVARTGQFPIAISQDITTTATSTADTVAQAASLGLFPFESLAPTVTRTALLPIEVPGGVARTLLAAIEALGRVSPVAILPIDEATIVVLYVPADVTVQDQAVVVVTAADSPYATVLVTDGALVLVAVTDSVR